MVIKCYSKINLTLKVNFKSKNGLHEIQSLYSLIDLFDQIKVSKNKKIKDEIIFKGPFAKFVNKRNNSVNTLIKKLRELNLISTYYSIEITKNIPVFGGLGGGTSNAAFLLKYLLKDKIDNHLLEELEGKIGSDLKLFFVGQGFLKDLKTINKFKKKYKFHYILIQPNIKCSTKEIYSHVKRYSKKKKFDKKISFSKKNFLNYVSKSGNDLQFIVEKKYPIISKLLVDIKNQKGCYLSRISGSGSVCYGLFPKLINAKKALNKLKIKYPKFWFSIAKTV
tara:strand:- start:54 stop:890 length:837 start_codon:yes stop_codon:yes gene_type:complete